MKHIKKIIIGVGAAIVATLLLDDFIVESSIASERIRRMLLSRPGNVDLVERIAWRAYRIDGEPGYRLLSDCYLYLENEVISGGDDFISEESYQILIRAFAGYATMHRGEDGFIEHESKFQRIMKLRRE